MLLFVNRWLAWPPVSLIVIRLSFFKPYNDAVSAILYGGRYGLRCRKTSNETF